MLYPRWVRFFFVEGFAIHDPEGRLEGSGNQVRSIRVNEDAAASFLVGSFDGYTGWLVAAWSAILFGVAWARGWLAPGNKGIKGTVTFKGDGHF